MVKLSMITEPVPPGVRRRSAFEEVEIVLSVNDKFSTFKFRKDKKKFNEIYVVTELMETDLA